MTSSTTQAVSRLLIVLIIFAFVLPTVGCRKRVKRSQLDIRQIQTRVFDVKDDLLVMKATMEALQDEGYIIGEVNDRLGLISAHKSQSVRGGVHTDKASVTISKINKGVKVRINIVRNTHKNGSSFWGTKAAENARPIHQEKFYTNIFQKIDKSIFYKKENI